jgi:hypothetical protein
MTDMITKTPPAERAPTGNLATEKEAREVAEAAREKDWEAPSFVRELFARTARIRPSATTIRKSPGS